MASTARSIPIQGQEKEQEQTKPVEELKTTAASSRERAESDVEMEKEKQLGATTGMDQKDADELLLWLARYGVDRNHPRPVTGTLRVGMSGEVMTVQADERVSRIFQKLVTEGFLCAPVLDSKGKYTGYNIDLLDLVHHTLTCFHEWRTSSTSTSGSKSDVVTQDFWNSYFEREEFTRSHAMDVISRNPMRAYKHEHIATRDFSTLYCMEIMARLGQHRVIVIDREWTVSNILTQSMIISLISQNMKRLGSIATIRISDLISYLPAGVETVRQSDLTADAFNYMVKTQVSGVGIVNAEGQLVDTLSVRDLRGIGSNAQHFMKLWLSVAQFKDQVRQMYPRQTPATPLCVTMSDPFSKIIENMFDGNIHRVWIVRNMDDMKPLRVCTQRDVIRILLAKMGQTTPILL